MSKRAEYVLWGSHPLYCGGEPIKLLIGSVRQLAAEQRSRRRDGGWLLGVYAVGTAPVGLRLRAAERRSA